MLKKYKFEILLIFILVANFFLIFQIFGFELGGDAGGFLGGVDYLTGKKEVEFFSQEFGRLFLRPLAPLIGAFLTILVADSYQSMLLQNLIFYLTAPFLLFYAAYYFFKQKKLAFYASVFYITAYPYLDHSLNFMSDIGVWFFLVLSILLSLKYLSVHKANPKVGNIILWLIPIICFLGFLMKESGSIGIGFFILVILLATDFDLKEKIKKILLVTVIFSIILVAYEVVSYILFNYNFIVFYSDNLNHYANRNYNLSSIIKKLIATFSIGWLYVVFGAYRIFKSQDWQKKIILLALIPTSFSFLLWNYQTSRLMYVIGPLLSLLAVAGINIKKSGVKFRIIEALLIILFIVFNCLTQYLARNFDLLFFL